MKNKVYLALFVSGTCIGWLMGMTISGIVGGILTSIVTLVLTVVASLSGMERQPEGEAPNKRVQVNPVPVAVVIVGITVGGALGIYTRTHQLLADHSHVTAPKQTPKHNAEMAEEERKALLGIFFESDMDACSMMCNEKGNTLRQSLIANTNGKSRELVETLSDDQLTLFLEALCGSCR